MVQKRRRIQALFRALPIRWRILSISLLNSALAAVLLLSVLDGATILADAWGELRQVRRTERLLGGIDRDTERLQGLVHRYNTHPDVRVLEQIGEVRTRLLARLSDEARADAFVKSGAEELTRLVGRLLAGFDALRDMRASVSRTFDAKISRPSREMAGLYGVIEGLEQPSRSVLLPPLSRSREAYHAMLLAANAYYLSTSPASAAEVGRHAATIQRTVPVMIDLADDETQRLALTGLKERAAAFAGGIDDLAGDFARETRILETDIDGSTQALSREVDTLTTRVRDVELSAQARFDDTLAQAGRRLGIVAVAFLGLVVFAGVGVSSSISEPLSDLRDGMLAIAEGDYDRTPPDTAATDEIGDMARAVEVFRQNALAKLVADEQVMSAKERAESALSELRATQASLIEAEKLAALGGLVAGVAHEVNNPVGIGLTVASSLTHRCRAITGDIAAGNLKRSHLTEFVAGVEEAAAMIVSNLYRASDLVQSFKQVAVDRSSHERRRFDLARTCEQISASLRPGLKAGGVALDVRVPDGIELESYPGPLGQLLTNLFLNAVRHGFPEGCPGRIELTAELDAERVCLIFRDDGRGMSEEVRRRAFEPFFTTRRGDGGTGLGLHIVFNIATHQLGGRISLESAPGAGCRYLLSIPLVAPLHVEESWRPTFA